MAAINKAKIPVGFVIAGKYRITGELGRGGMAAVYEAENVDIGKRVAIKVLAQELISSAVVVERFLREARAVAAIRSPYICDVYDSGRLEDGRPFLVLELLEGESLYEQMIRVGQLDVPTTVAIVTQTCKGLIKAHSASIVHRDLKPENIFITHDEEGRILAKILDFGLAKFYSSMETGNAGQARLTREGAVFGTPAYMSPEQVRGQGAVDSRADLWALACITYESLTGRTVWSTEQGVAMTFAQIANAPLPDAYALRPDLPEGFGPWFARALDRNIEKRFQTPKEFSEELLHAMHLAPGSSAGLDSDEFALYSGVKDLKLDAPFGSDPRASSLGGAAGQPRGSRAHFAAPGSPGAGATKPDGDKDAGPSTAKPYGGPSAGRLVVAFGIVGLVGAAAYGGYRALVPQTQPTSVTTAPLPSGEPSASTSVASAAPSQSALAIPQNGLPFRAAVSRAQDAIAAKDYDGAQKALKEAVTQGNHPMPIALTQHLSVAMQGLKANAVCKLTGLGRPRTYDLLEDKVKVIPASQPVISLGSRGPLVLWTENREGNDQIYAVSLDDSLKPRTVPIDVSPEGAAVSDPSIRPVGDRFMITYWNARGPETGVFARYLNADGEIVSQQTPIAKATGVAAWPTILPIPAAGAGASIPGRYAITWIAPTERNTDDLFLRIVNENLEAQGDPIRVTALQPGLASKSKLRFPSSAVDADAAHFAVRLEHDPDRLIEHVRVPWGDLQKGINPKDLGPKAPDASMGEMALVNVDRGHAEQPSMACGTGGCFVVWNDEGKDGANYAYIENGKSAPLSRGLLDKRGRHPVVAAGANGGVQAFWFEGQAVMTAPMDQHGAKDGSPIGHVMPGIPLPSAVAGRKAGEWYLAWNDIEGGHLEVFVARAECR